VSLAVLMKTLPILLLLAVGFLFRRAHFLSPGAVEEIKRLVVGFALPALLFLAFLRVDFEARYIWIVAVVFALNLAMLGIGELAALALDRENPYLPLMFTGFETGMLGFALFGTVYGRESLGALGILDLGQEAYVWFVLMTILLGLGGAPRSPGKVLKSFATSPVILAIVLGVALNLTGLARPLEGGEVGGAIVSTLTLVSQLTSPLVLIVIGYQLDLKPGKLGRPLATAALRTAILVGLAAAVDRVLIRGILGLPAVFSAALFTMFILPPPFVMPLFMGGSGAERQDYVSNTLTIGVLLSMAAFVVVAATFAPA